MGNELSNIAVKDIMTRAVISVDPLTTVYQIAKMMEQGGIGAVLVKNNNTPQGIITDRDFAIKIAVNKYPMDTPAHKVASQPLQKINADESILVAANIMTAKKIRKLAVTENDHIVGIITSTDIVNQFVKTNKI